MQHRPLIEMIRHFPENGMKYLLGNPRTARELLALEGTNLLDLLDWSKVQLDSTTYVQRDYRHVAADVVLHGPLRQRRKGKGPRRVLIYILIEHQSEPDRWMALRMLEYVVQVYKSQLRTLQQGGGRATNAQLGPVLPVVFYTGEKSWPEVEVFAELIALSDRFQPVLPSLKPLYINLNAMPATQLETTGGFLGWVLRLVQNWHSPREVFGQTLEQAIGHLEALQATERQRWLELLSYLHALVYHERDVEEHAELIDRIADSAQTDEHRKEIFRMGKLVRNTFADQVRKQEAVAVRQETLQSQLEERFGSVPVTVKQTIRATHNVKTLKLWLKRLVVAESLADVGILAEES